MAARYSSPITAIISDFLDGMILGLFAGISVYACMTFGIYAAISTAINFVFSYYSYRQCKNAVESRQWSWVIYYGFFSIFYMMAGFTALRLADMPKPVGEQNADIDKDSQPNNASEANLPDTSFETRSLQHEYKHAGDFGITGNWNANNGELFKEAIKNHIDVAPEVYLSTYRGNNVYVYFDPDTKLGVYVDMNGNFVSGWKLSEAQINFHTNNGTRIK